MANGGAKAPAKTYDWGGGSKGHSISLSQHQKNVAGKTPATPAVDPLYTSAQQQAQAYYSPQTNALSTLQRSTPAWFENYMAGSRAAQTNAANYAAPVIAQAQNFAQNIATPAAGLDPNSAEYAKSQQAGKGLGALAQLGVQNLQANQQATTDYFGGQQSNAARYQPQALASYETQKGTLGSQIQGRTQELYSSARTQQTNEDIARETLKLNTLKAGNYDPVTGQKMPAKAPTASDQKSKAELDYFNQHGYWPPTGPPKAPTVDKQAAKDAAKHATAIQKATGSAKVKVQDIMDAWGRGGTITDKVPDPSQPVNLITGQRPMVDKQRSMTRDELRKALGSKYGGQWVSIMERVRAGQALTQPQIDYLHSTSPDLRVPKEWIKGKPRTAPSPSSPSRPGNAPSTTPGQYRPT